MHNMWLLMIAAVAAAAAMCELPTIAVVCAAAGLAGWFWEKQRCGELALPLAADEWPKVSIIIPAHNEEKYLGATLDSLLAQKYPGPKLELVAALNGCTDGTRQVAESYPGVIVVESEKSGISFGRNLGAGVSGGSILIFVDADTLLPADCIEKIVEPLRLCRKAVVAVPGRPDRGGPVVRGCFWLANNYARRNRLSPPGPATAISRELFDAIGGFDENLPQGTVSDILKRAQQAGASYVFVNKTYVITSIRRFEKTGIVRQMLAWRKNHQDLAKGQRDKVSHRDYEVIR